MVIGRRQVLFFLVILAVIVASAFACNFLLEKRLRAAAAPSEIDTIVIDPGHGGFDGGASANGLIEKDINLAIALKLKELLKLNGFKVVMTREEDLALCEESLDAPVVSAKKTDMRKRLEIMDNTPNSLTVSVHQNKFSEASSKGAQVFYGFKNPMSEILAKSIQQSFARELQKDNKRQVKKAQKDLFLLYYTTAPAVIVECGFLSNYEEAQKLKDSRYQTQVAFAILEGIINFTSGREPA